MLEKLKMRLKDDNSDLLRFKQSVSSDIGIAVENMHEKVFSFGKCIEESVHLANKHEKMLKLMLEASMIDNLLQKQEAEDKK